MLSLPSNTRIQEHLDDIIFEAQQAIVTACRDHYENLIAQIIVPELPINVTPASQDKITSSHEFILRQRRQLEDRRAKKLLYLSKDRSRKTAFRSISTNTISSAPNRFPIYKKNDHGRKPTVAAPPLLPTPCHLLLPPPPLPPLQPLKSSIPPTIYPTTFPSAPPPIPPTTYPPVQPSIPPVQPSIPPTTYPPVQKPPLSRPPWLPLPPPQLSRFPPPIPSTTAPSQPSHVLPLIPSTKAPLLPLPTPFLPQTVIPPLNPTLTPQVLTQLVTQVVMDILTKFNNLPP